MELFQFLGRLGQYHLWSGGKLPSFLPLRKAKMMKEEFRWQNVAGFGVIRFDLFNDCFFLVRWEPLAKVTVLKKKRLQYLLDADFNFVNSKMSSVVRIFWFVTCTCFLSGAMKFKILQDSPPSKLSFKRGGTIKKAWKKLASLEDNWCIAVEVFPPFFWKISLEAWHSKISTCKQPQQKALKREIWEALPQKPGKFRCVLLSFLGRFFGTL